MEQRINLLSHEVHESVKDNEAANDRLRRMIQENREAAHRSHAASEDETLKDLEQLEKRMFSVEKTVGIRTPAGEWNLNPVAQLSDRASSSVVNANFRELNLKIEKALLEHKKFAKWASESIGGINEEQTLLANRMSRLQSGRGSQAIDRSSGPISPQDWHEAIDEVNRKVQDLSRGVQRHHGDHDDVLARFETLRSRVEQHEATSGILNQVLDDIRRQIRSLPANSDQARSAVRREIDSFRSTLEGAMRRISTVESNMRTLNGMNNRIMAQLFEIEGHVDEAAVIIQGARDDQANPPQPRERRNVGYDAFAGQGHRIRSPTPTPGEGNGRGTGLPMRPGGGVDLVDHALPGVPGRVDPSRADRHPINPDRERADSRSRRARGLPDRSHSPVGRARDGPRARAQGGTFLFLPIGMWVGIGARGLLPPPIGDLRPEVDNQGWRGRSAIVGVSLRV